ELPPVPFWNMVDGGYFAAMKIPLLEGRVFTQSDTADAPKVTVIDEYLAKKYWPGRSAVGGQIRRGPNADSTLFTVIGVVGNVQSMDLGDKSKMGTLYLDYREDVQRNVYVVARTAASDTRAIAAVRDVLRQADPELALFDVKSMPARISTSLRDRRAAMVICLAFAGLALALSAIGIYGVLAYTVTQRTREFGIRIALGAGVGDVAGMVVKQGVKLAALGLAIGIGGGARRPPVMGNLVFEGKHPDPADLPPAP